MHILFSFLFISMQTLVLNRAYNRAGEGEVEGSVKSGEEDVEGRSMSAKLVSHLILH